MTPDHIKQLLRNYSIKPNKTYGQNFLLSEVVLEDTIDAAQVVEGDVVLEIGPGIATLTERLLARGARVLAIEKDSTFVPILHDLKKRYPKTFRFEIEDALQFNFCQKMEELWGEGVDYKVVANIPYYITGKIIQLLLNAPIRPESITILMQKEVAHNVVAKPGNLSVLALSVQLYADAQIVMEVPRHLFYPAPEVDSSVLQLRLLLEPRVEIGNNKAFFSMLRACFSGKRKQIHNTFANFLHSSKSEAVNVLEEAGIDPNIRPQDVTLEQWSKLAKLVQKYATT